MGLTIQSEALQMDELADGLKFRVSQAGAVGECKLGDFAVRSNDFAAQGLQLGCWRGVGCGYSRGDGKQSQEGQEIPIAHMQTEKVFRRVEASPFVELAV